jgi:hypothetical protein
VRGIVGVAGLTGRTGRELRSDRLAEHDPTRHARERDAGGICPGPVSLIGLGAVGGRHVAGIHDVLDADRDTVERATPWTPIERLGRRDRLLRIEMLPGADGRLALRDPIEIGAQERLGREAAAFDAADGIDGCETGQVRHRESSGGKAAPI